jgi:hypothetical protein
MDEEDNKVNEPGVEYRGNKPAAKRSITFFNSFEEAELHSLKQMAAHSPEERLANLEILRKRTWHHLLLPNGQWHPLPRIITIEKGTFQ